MTYQLAFRSPTGLACFIPLVASGAIIGISFIAQPAKFLLREVERSDLVSVGSAMFHASHLCQLLIFVLLFAFALVKRNRAKALMLATALLLTLAVQITALMPSLDESLRLMKSGHAVSTGGLHLAYGALEILKIGCLWWFAALPSEPPRPRAQLT